MAISPNAAPQVAIPQVNEMTYDSFEKKVYSNGREHVYGVTVNHEGKQIRKHISNAAVVEAYGLDVRSSYVPDTLGDGSDNPERPVLGGYGFTVQENLINNANVSTTPPNTVAVTATPNVLANQNAAPATVAAIGGAAVGRPGFFSRIKEKVAAGYNKTQDWVANGYENSKTRIHKNIAKAALATLLIGGAAAVVMSDGAESHRSEASAATLAASPGASSGEFAAVPANPDQAGRETAGTQKIADIGLQAGQYNVLDANNEKTLLPGEIEANQFSMNHGPDAWKNYNRTIEGAKQMGADILSAKGTFSASDANVAKEALTKANVPQAVIDMLAANNYADLTLKSITVNSPTYKGMSFNSNGELAIQGMRAGVGNDDVIFIISYKNPSNGKFESVATRGDCGGVGPQVFESVEVPTPPTPPAPPAPAPTPTTIPGSTTVPKTPPTTGPKVTVTTKLIPSTTTTKVVVTTTKPPTSTTKPPTTTTLPNKNPDDDQKNNQGSPNVGPGSGGSSGPVGTTVTTKAPASPGTTIVVGPPDTEPTKPYNG